MDCVIADLIQKFTGLPVGHPGRLGLIEMILTLSGEMLVREQHAVGDGTFLLGRRGSGSSSGYPSGYLSAATAGSDSAPQGACPSV